MMKHRLVVVTITSLLLLMQGAMALAAPNTDYDTTIHDVELRPGVEVDIHVEIFVNEAAPCERRTFFAVHGFAHTAATWQPLAEALFDNNPTGPVVCRMAAINLPGRGGSSLPTNLSYSELTLDDHVTAILATLDALRLQGVRPRTLVGHSQGGLLIQMAQQRLRDAGTHLRRQFGIRDAILLASAGPVQIPWPFVDNGTADVIISQFLTNDPTLGQVIDIPDAAFPGIFFTNLLGDLASGAPTPAQVASRGYNAPAPLFATLQLVGEAPFSRPSVDARIFARQRGTRLFMATYEQDILFRPNESAQLYRHLTGDNNRRRLKRVNGPETVHDLHISDPDGLLASVADKIQF